MFQLSNRISMASRASAARASHVPALSRYTNAPRLFSTQTRMQIKEDAERSPEELERIKQEQLKKQEKGEGHWHEELASSGEASIAADKQNVNDHEEHMEDLQKETAGKSEEEHPHGKA